MDLKDKSEDYVNATFDIVMDEAATDKAAQDKLNKGTERNDGDEDQPQTSDEARKKMIADSKEAWKTPINK
jgi:hypothetical protein